MTKQISTKYTLLVTSVILIITFIFIPVYIVVQKNVYINLAKKHISLMYDNLVSSTDLSDYDALADFFKNDNNTVIEFYNVTSDATSLKEIVIYFP